MEFSDNILMLCTPGHGVDKSLVKVEWKKNYCRQSLPFISEKIETEWNKKSILCPSIWNGSKFRLHEVQLHTKENCHLPQVKLLLGSTCYKDFIGTNCGPESETLISLGLQYYGNSQAYVSDPLGVGALIVTNDNNTIFIRRSRQCAEFPFLVDRPGGHPEPDDVIGRSGEDFQNMDPSLILEEIFDSILKEVFEEVNIPKQNLSSPLLLGVSYNPLTIRTPSLEFYVKCELSASEIRELYKKRIVVDIEESSELIVIPVKEIFDNSLEELKYYDQFTFGAKAVISFFKVYSSK